MKKHILILIIIFFVNNSYSQSTNCMYFTRNNLSILVSDLQIKFNYSEISKQKGLKKEFEIQKNFQDTLKSDSIIYLSKSNNNYVYYFDAYLAKYNLKQIKIIDAKFNCKYYYFNMDILTFCKINLPNKKIKSNIKCIEISNTSGYDDFKFYFKNNKLISIVYFDNSY
jgi:hypothetical protein